MRSGPTGRHKQTSHTAQAGNPTESQRPEQDFTDVCRIHPLTGEKKSSCSMLHLRKAFPSSQHSLEPQHTFVWPAVCAVWLPGRLSPSQQRAQGHHRDTTGSSWGSARGHGRKSPTAGKGRGCWLQGNLCQYGTSRYRAKSRCSVLPQLRASTHGMSQAARDPQGCSS